MAVVINAVCENTARMVRLLDNMGDISKIPCKLPKNIRSCARELDQWCW